LAYSYTLGFKSMIFFTRLKNGSQKAGYLSERRAAITENSGKIVRKLTWQIKKR